MKKLLFVLALTLGGCSSKSMPDAKAAEAETRKLCAELASERASNHRLDSLCKIVDDSKGLLDAGAEGR